MLRIVLRHSKNTNIADTRPKTLVEREVDEAMIIEICCWFFAVARVRVPEAVMARRLVSMIAAIA